MAAGLADHVWAVREWITMPCVPCAWDTIGLSRSQRIIDSLRAKVGSPRALAVRGDLTYEDQKTILRSLGVRVHAFKGGCRVAVEVEDAIRYRYEKHNPGTCC
jgi:hypothetical protein